MAEHEPDEALHERALYLAGALEVDPGRVDPVEAGTVGADYLDRFVEGGATPEAVELGVLLLDFALACTPDHEDADRWRYRAGDALSFLAGETGSTAHLDTAIAHLTAVAHRDTDFADPAAADLAGLVASRLAIAAQDEDLDADAVRRLTDVLAGLDPAGPDRVDFLLQRAHAHRWAYPRTQDPADLDHVVHGVAAALPDLEPDEEARIEALEALVAVHEERFLLSGSLEPLEAALVAAREARSLLADDPERAPAARVAVAALVAARFWNSPVRDDADRDEAIAEYT
ncbi:MAG: hypothetical protein HOY78_03060, partial [Saccharothrix sp.]|nr:hypothetical protein [Saccharothrix sp.]